MGRIGPWEPGAALPVLAPAPISRVQIAKFAAATGDFNPIHCDEEFAQKAGFPSVIAHGPLTLALVAQSLTNAFGPHNIREVHVQFRAPVVPGDRLRVQGTVTDVSQVDGELRALCELRVVRGQEETVAAGRGQAVIENA